MQQLQTDSFKPARSTDVNFGLPAPLKNLLKRSTTARPAITAQYQRCGHCVTHCPPEAMTLSGQGVDIDFDRCIRCFCCQELCPHDAIVSGSTDAEPVQPPPPVPASISLPVVFRLG